MFDTRRSLQIPAFALLLAAPAFVSVEAATKIPADLEARSVQLQQQASAQVRTWAHDQGVALAKAHGPVDIVGLQRAAKSRFGEMQAGQGGGSHAVIGDLSGMDIEALVFVIMMNAAEAAEDDLRTVLAETQAINKQKEALRKEEEARQKSAAQIKTAAAASPTPTPGPDRVTQLVAAARGIVGKTQSANLSKIAAR